MPDRKPPAKILPSTQLLVLNSTTGERTVVVASKPDHGFDEHTIVLKGSYHDGSEPHPPRRLFVSASRRESCYGYM